MEKISTRIAKKSLNAAISALELYNKPDMKYREESFCILIVNAYELLFKAKIIRDNNCKINSIYVYENKKSVDGRVLKKKVIKRNRIRQPYTIDINKCINTLLMQNIITNNVKENISALIEIRDNSIHLFNSKSNIKETLYKLCVAAIKNYVRLLKEWFKEIDINKYNFFITPLNFDTIIDIKDPLNKTIAEKDLLNYLESISSASSEEDDFDILVNVELSFTKNRTDEAVLLKYASEGRKITMYLSDEMFKKMYPYNNSEIIGMIRKKNTDFKQDKKFNKIKKKLQENEICCKARYLDVLHKQGKPRFFYNANFVDKVLEKYK